MPASAELVFVLRDEVRGGGPPPGAAAGAYRSPSRSPRRSSAADYAQQMQDRWEAQERRALEEARKAAKKVESALAREAKKKEDDAKKARTAAEAAARRRAREAALRDRLALKAVRVIERRIAKQAKAQKDAEEAAAAEQARAIREAKRQAKKRQEAAAAERARALREARRQAKKKQEAEEAERAKAIREAKDQARQKEREAAQLAREERRKAALERQAANARLTFGEYQAWRVVGRVVRRFGIRGSAQQMATAARAYGLRGSTVRQVASRAAGAIGTRGLIAAGALTGVAAAAFAAVKALGAMNRTAAETSRELGTFARFNAEAAAALARMDLRRLQADIMRSRELGSRAAENAELTQKLLLVTERMYVLLESTALDVIAPLKQAMLAFVGNVADAVDDWGVWSDDVKKALGDIVRIAKGQVGAEGADILNMFLNKPPLPVRWNGREFSPTPGGQVPIDAPKYRDPLPVVIP